MKAVRVNAWGQPATVEEIEQPTAGRGAGARARSRREQG